MALTIACERPTSHVTGTDISSDALEVARDNAIRLGALPHVAFREGDLYECVTGERFDLVTANPPYIPEDDIATLSPTIRDFEPRVALTGGVGGLEIVRRIVAEAPKHLSTRGVLAIEIGAGQIEDVTQLFQDRGFEGIERKKDYGGIYRVVSGVWPEAQEP